MSCTKIVNSWTSDGGRVLKGILKLKEDGSDDNHDAIFFWAKCDGMLGLEDVDKGVGMWYVIKSFITIRNDEDHRSRDLFICCSKFCKQMS